MSRHAKDMPPDLTVLRSALRAAYVVLAVVAVVATGGTWWTVATFACWAGSTLAFVTAALGAGFDVGWRTGRRHLHSGYLDALRCGQDGGRYLDTAVADDWRRRAATETEEG